MRLRGNSGSCRAQQSAPDESVWRVHWPRARISAARAVEAREGAVCRLSEDTLEKQLSQDP